MAQRAGRGKALLFHDRGARGVSGQQHAPAALYPRERSGTQFKGGWVGPRAVLDGRKNLVPTGIRSLDRPTRSSVSIRTELPGPHMHTHTPHTHHTHIHIHHTIHSYSHTYTHTPSTQRYTHIPTYTHTHHARTHTPHTHTHTRTRAHTHTHTHTHIAYYLSTAHLPPLSVSV